MNARSPLVLACQWVSRMAWLNIIWFILTLSGGVIFGIAPATVAVCTLLRRYLNGAGKIKLSESWDEYKKVFVRSNQVFWVISLPAFSLAWYVNWVILNGSGVASVISMTTLPLLVIVLIWMFLVLVQMSIYQTSGVKADFINGYTLFVSDKKIVLMTVVVSTALLLFLFLVPILILIFGFIPLFLGAVAWLWHHNEELSTLNV